MGGIFGIAAFQVDALRVNMMQKGIFLGAGILVLTEP
jgi:hypothetical protein